MVAKITPGAEFVLSLGPKIINPLKNKDGKNCSFFVCFGLLLGLVRDGGLIRDSQGTIKPGEDLDFGVLYEECNYQQNVDRIVNAFKCYGFSLKNRIRNDITKETFYLSFKGTRPDHPEVCVFFWYKHKENRYHTYDVNREGKEIPSEYVFKGLPAYFLEKTVRICPPCLNRETTIPLYYGSCLDVWYPLWFMHKNIESTTNIIHKMKSCAEWGKI